MPTPFQDQVLAALRNRADKLNVVTGTFTEIADDIGDGSSAGDVHETMIQLKKAGYFSQHYFDGLRFDVTLA